MSWEKNFTKWVGSKNSVIIHTLFFILMFSLIFFGFKADTILLVLTTVVSLEAIYLAIFIQMTVNQNTESLEDVEEELEDIVEEVGEISEDIDEIQQDVDEIQEDVEGISEDVEEIQQDVDEIEKETETYEGESKKDHKKLEDIEIVLRKLLQEIENLKK